MEEADTGVEELLGPRGGIAQVEPSREQTSRAPRRINSRHSAAPTKPCPPVTVNRTPSIPSFSLRCISARLQLRACGYGAEITRRSRIRLRRRRRSCCRFKFLVASLWAELPGQGTGRQVCKFCRSAANYHTQMPLGGLEYFFLAWFCVYIRDITGCTFHHKNCPFFTKEIVLFNINLYIEKSMSI